MAEEGEDMYFPLSLTKIKIKNLTIYIIDIDLLFGFSVIGFLQHEMEKLFSDFFELLDRLFVGFAAHLQNLEIALLKTIDEIGWVLLELINKVVDVGV